MRKTALLFACLLISCGSLSAQKVVDNFLRRFDAPEKGRTVFMPKGCYAYGMGASFRSFSASGDDAGEGYSILSILNIGNGNLNIWSVSPGISWFIADDVSIGFRIDYSGYRVNTNLQLDFRDVLGEDDPEYNVQISSRHMLRHVGGLSFTSRWYRSFFGSKTFGVFGEARVFGNYGLIKSHPLKEDVTKFRTSRVISAGVKIAGGACVKLRDNNALTVSIPLVGAALNHTRQKKESDGRIGNARMTSFNISRNVDLFGIQVGYVHYVEPKRK